MQNDIIYPIYFLDDEYEMWMHIPGFNGYQISNRGDVRSYKHYRTYMYSGRYIKVYGQAPNCYVVLSNNRNERKKMYIYELMDMAFNDYDNHNPNKLAVYNNTYHCGFNLIKDIPKTEEERAKLGFGIFDNISKALSSEPSYSVDMYGNIIE